MKYIPLRKTGLGLLVIAGALTPLASLGAESMVWSYDESAVHDNLRSIQAAPSMIDAERGAQGPVRTEFTEPVWSYDESAVYDNLRKIQAAPSMTTGRGAQGPVRTDFMEPTWSYSESATYDNLRSIQSAQ
ncbi:MAG: hypothetical protein Q7J47_20600 [Azoarcus sp.]|nr:hypothetical protein [Azoarcus sp.]